MINYSEARTRNIRRPPPPPPLLSASSTKTQKTMPEIPTSYRDATSILELLERDERTNGARTSGAGRRTTGKGKGVAVESGAGRSTTGKVKGVAVTSGVEYIPYSPPATSANPRASQAAGSGIKLSRQ